MAFERHMLHSRFKRLCVNVVEPSVIQLIRSGKLNLQELLIVGLFRIGVEVWRSETEVLRLSELISEKTGISDIRYRYNIPETGWSYMVEPSPTGSKRFSQDADFDNEEQFEPEASHLGLFPGATLRFYPEHLRTMMER